jgi:hypothetical protein
VSYLGVRGDRSQHVGIPFDGEIHAPVVVDPGLPEARALLVLLRSQGGVAEVAEEIRELLAEGLLNLRRARDQKPMRAVLTEPFAS